MSSSDRAQPRLTWRLLLATLAVLWIALLACNSDGAGTAKKTAAPPGTGWFCVGGKAKPSRCARQRAACGVQAKQVGGGSCQPKTQAWCFTYDTGGSTSFECFREIGHCNDVRFGSMKNVKTSLCDPWK